MLYMYSWGISGYGNMFYGNITVKSQEHNAIFNKVDCQSK